MTPLNFVNDDPEKQNQQYGHRRVHEGALLARTVVRLRPAQVAHRIRLRTLRTAERRWPGLVTRSVDPPRPSAPWMHPLTTGMQPRSPRGRSPS